MFVGVEKYVTKNHLRSDFGLIDVNIAIHCNGAIRFIYLHSYRPRQVTVADDGNAVIPSGLKGNVEIPGGIRRDAERRIGQMVCDRDHRLYPFRSMGIRNLSPKHGYGRGINFDQDRLSFRLRFRFGESERRRRRSRSVEIDIRGHAAGRKISGLAVFGEHEVSVEACAVYRVTQVFRGCPRPILLTSSEDVESAESEVTVGGEEQGSI